MVPVTPIFPWYSSKQDNIADCNIVTHHIQAQEHSNVNDNETYHNQAQETGSQITPIMTHQ